MSDPGALRWPRAVEDYPAIHLVDEGTLLGGRLPLLCRLHDQMFVVHGVKHSRAVAARISLAYGIPAERSAVVAGATDDAVYRLMQMPALAACSTIVVVGGGSVQDVAKFVARQRDLRLIAIPTLVATDGIASPVAVIRDAAGHSTSRAGKAPDDVLICWSLLAEVPDRYWLALVGDIVGNLVAVRDFRIFGMAGLPEAERKIAEQSCQLAERAALQILEYGQPALADEKFRRILVESAVESSFAMVCAGTSEPCSGAEHLLSHAIDSLRLQPVWLHGLQVGAAVPSCLRLHGEADLSGRVERLYRSLGMPSGLTLLGGEISGRLNDVVRMAPTTRPGRRTILSQFSAPDLVRLLSLQDISQTS